MLAPPDKPTKEDIQAIAKFLIQQSYDDGVGDVTLERSDTGFAGQFVDRSDPKKVFQYEITHFNGGWGISFSPISGVEDNTEDFTECSTTLPIWNPPPFDFAEEADYDEPADILAQIAFEQTGPIFQDWLDTLELHLFDGAESLEDVRDRVESAYPRLDAASFAATMQQVMLLGYGAGRYEVLEEVGKDISQSLAERPILGEQETEFSEIQTALRALQYLQTARNTESISLLFSELSTDVMKLDFSESDNLILTYAEIGRKFTELVSLELEWLDFAATKKGPKRNCKTGFPCGSSCITRTKSCRNPLEGQFKTAAEWLENQVKKPDLEPEPDPTPVPTPPKKNAASPTTAKEFIELGEAFIPEKFLRDFEEFKNGTSPARQKAKAEYDAVKQEMMTALNKRLSDKKMKPIRDRYFEKEEAYFKLEYAERAKLEASLEEFRQSIIASGISKKEATLLVNRINFDSSYRDGLSDEFSDKDLKDSMVEFYMLTGGQGSDSLKSLVKESDRAWANEYTGKINIGKGNKETMFHEMGHHVEFEDEILRASAREWIKTRAEGPTQKLKDLTGVDYRDSEVAFPDKFISPYVGKDYGEFNPTEVVSMGIEYFKDGKAMLELYEKDAEHFAFILGAIKRKRNNA